MKTVLILGSSGALGRSTAAFFQSKKWHVLGADIAEAKSSCDKFCLLQADKPIAESQEQLDQFAGNVSGLKAVINLSGGWAGGDISDSSVCATTDLMLKQSVLSSVLASHLFATKADESSLLVLTGASASLQPTPSMIGYGMSKAAVHFLTKSLASDPRLISRGDSVLCILPSTLDTEANRLGMPDADRSSWTPLDDVSSALWKWAEGTDLPASGSLVGFKTQQGKTTRVIQ